jgi:lysyl-tRNA synthetase class 2
MAEDELFEARRAKIDALQQRGVDPWPPKFSRTHLAEQLRDDHKDLQAGEDSGQRATVAGRVISTRVQGKVGFGDIVDTSGKIQLFVTKEGVEAFDQLDVGDIVGASGEVVRTKRGELSIRTNEVVLLAKSLRAPPAKWHGLQDVETRFRQRYLDLMANPEARKIAETRTQAIKSVRAFYDARGYLEVETPTLHPIPGGGTAQPFKTHYNLIERDMYLRVATELYLKRLVVGGLERVYEIGRIFRNEGMSFKHSPESTMLESYEAYADYLDMMELTQTLTQHTAKESIGTTEVSFRGHEFDLGADWRRVTMHDLVGQATNTNVTPDTPTEELNEIAARHKVKTEPWWGPGMIVGEIYDKVAEATIVEPTIVCEYPIEISPLARKHRDDPRLVERFEVVICGMELANAFSELNDPIDQRERFEAQQKAREHGDLEANPMDLPYVEALEYGLPPTGGMGMGMDRLVMVLTGAPSIREVILFPALRAEGDDSQDDKG